MRKLRSLLRIIRLSDSGDAQWGLAFHHNGRKFGSVAAETEERSGSCQDRIRQPGEPLRPDTDHFWPFVAIERGDLPDGSKLSVACFLQRLNVARLPRRLVFHEHLDVVLPRRFGMVKASSIVLDSGFSTVDKTPYAAAISITLR